MTQPIKTALSLLPLAGYLVFLVLLAYSKPLYTWDTVPYTATILSADISDPTLLHARTYAYLQSAMTPQQYAAVTSGPYAADLKDNAEHFIGQLDMYRIKPAYVIALRTLTALGAEPLTSLRLLSVIPGVLLCLLLFVWLSRSCSTLSAALIVVIFAVVGRLADLSRVPVPDNLSALIVFAALYALVCKRWLRLAVFFARRIDLRAHQQYPFRRLGPPLAELERLRAGCLNPQSRCPAVHRRASSKQRALFYNQWLVRLFMVATVLPHVCREPGRYPKLCGALFFRDLLDCRVFGNTTSGG